jgi:hypothetical protein
MLISESFPNCEVRYIVLNVHAPAEEKIDDIKDRFYE